jgi:FKBP-type peptidyl-prolyl cis-trans isomerase (trigger factor)
MTNTNKKEAIKSYENLTTKTLDKSLVEISASIPTEVWEKYRAKALKNLNDSVTIDGFRKGMVPENILISKVGESTINEEMAELALSKAYLDILIDNKIDAIGKPQVKLTKLAPGNPLEFKATTAVVPLVKLPDYKKIAENEVKKDVKNEVKVEDKDLEEAILKIRKSRASHEGHDHDKMTPEEHEKAILDSLPEFNDDFVRSLGDFKDIEDFKAKVREMIGQNKKDEAREKLRIKIADAISEATTVELPEVMIGSELDRTQAQFSQDIEKMGVKLEDYLKHAKKTLEEIRKEWTPHAEKKAKLQLILNAIADAEKIKPDPKEIEAEVNHIVEHYKDADRERAAIYADTVLTNEKVFRMLEGK